MVTTETDPAKLEAVRRLGVTAVCDKSFPPEIVRNDHRRIGRGRGSVMNEVIREFLIETQENLAQLDIDLVTLEKDPTERETFSRVFRTLHTVKGTAGFLGLQKLQAVAHAAENLLSRLREGKLAFNAEIASALLAVVDAVRKMLEAVEASETDGTGDFSALIATLERLHAGGCREADSRLLRRSPPQAPAPPALRRTPKACRYSADGSCGEQRGPLIRGGGAGRARGGRIAFAGRCGQLHPRRRRPARQADEPRRRAGAGPQSDHAVQLVSGRHAVPGHRATAEPADRPSCRRAS